MTIAEKIEIVLIPVVSIGVWLFTPLLPGKLLMGRLFLAASALLLLQSLVRDLWLLAARKRREQTSPRTAARCMCIESTVGIAGIVSGTILLGYGFGQPISMAEWSWSILAGVVLSVGFLIKDFVFEWGPWRIRRDKDHMNIVFKWKT